MSLIETYVKYLSIIYKIKYFKEKQLYRLIILTHILQKYILYILWLNIVLLQNIHTSMVCINDFGPFSEKYKNSYTLA